MVTGLNTDVEHNGRVFHVQTEDGGVDKPILQSLVFCAGEIITVLECCYDRLVASPKYSADAVSRRLAMQHHRLINDINEGKFDASAVIVATAEASAQPRDELSAMVLDYLQQESPYDLDREKAAVESLIAPPSDTVDGVLAHLDDEVDKTAAGPQSRVEPEATPARSTRVTPAETEVRRVERQLAPASPRRPSRNRSAGTMVLVGVIASLAAGSAWWFLRPVETEMQQPAARPERVESAPPEKSSAPPHAEARTPAATAPPTEPVKAESRQSAPRREAPEVAEPIAQKPPTVTEIAEDATATTPSVAAPEQDPLPVPVAASPGRGTSEPGSEPSEATLELPVPVPLTGPDVLDVAPSEPEQPATVSAPAPSIDPTVPDKIGPGALVELAKVDVAPTATRRAMPEYSRRALKKRQQGRVELNLLIDERGNVAEVQVVAGIEGSDLTDVAAETAGSWKFTPARKGPHPVRVWKRVAVEFSIKDGKSTRVRVAE